jgi:hypothetical protein
MKLNEHGIEIEIENKKIEEIIYERNKNITNDSLQIKMFEIIQQ